MRPQPGLPHTLIGAADRCCAVVCDYRPEAVKHYLDFVLAMEAAGEDPGENAACKPINRSGSGGTVGNGATQVWDVRRAVEELRAERRDVTEVSVAMKLCPYSMDS